MIIIGLCGVNPSVLSDDIVRQSSVWTCVCDCPMMGLQHPRGVTREEVVCNFLLIATVLCIFTYVLNNCADAK